MAVAREEARGTQEVNGLAARIHDALPQTQCTRCGYPDCAGYAQAVAEGEAGINQCPPGGAEGIARLAQLTGRELLPLDPQFGTEGPRAMAVIDEAWCIGCTLCLDACPTDAIVGINKHMHTVIEAHCTGCELCIPVCPVDCISLEVGHAGPQRLAGVVGRAGRQQPRCRATSRAHGDAMAPCRRAQAAPLPEAHCNRRQRRPPMPRRASAR